MIGAAGRVVGPHQQLPSEFGATVIRPAGGSGSGATRASVATDAHSAHRPREGHDVPDRAPPRRPCRRPGDPTRDAVDDRPLGQPQTRREVLAAPCAWVPCCPWRPAGPVGPVAGERCSRRRDRSLVPSEPLRTLADVTALAQLRMTDGASAQLTRADAVARKRDTRRTRSPRARRTGRVSRRRWRRTDGAQPVSTRSIIPDRRRRASRSRRPRVRIARLGRSDDPERVASPRRRVREAVPVLPTSVAARGPRRRERQPAALGQRLERKQLARAGPDRRAAGH